MTTKPSIGGVFARHAIVEAIAALLVAVVHLFFLRGVSLGAILLFLVPMGIAFVYWQKSPRPPTRHAALSFFVLIAIGAAIAPFPAFLPNLGGIDRGLPAVSDRLLGWYAGIYLIFAAVVVPINAFIGNLLDQRRGRPTTISPPTCYLGLMAVVLLVPSLPWMLGKFFGFWPLF